MLLSIIIPTQNRYETLLPVISTLTNHISSNDIEFIIQDNSHDNSLGSNFFSKNTDNRVKYFYIQDPLSIKDNTIAAIENANGKYLLFIGDDDLVSPHIYKIIKYVDNNNIDCLIYSPGYYWWDSVNFSKPTYYHRNCAFWCPSINQKQIKRNAEYELQIVMQQGGTHYLNLPRFYHGIVKSEVLKRIKDRTGSYLNGASPDMAFAVAIALEIKEYSYISFPVSIFGASKNSGGGWTASNKHHGKIEDQKHLPKDIIQKWDTEIPLIWSEKTIYAQTVMEVLKEFKISRHIDYENLYATMLAYEPYLFTHIKPVLLKHAGWNICMYIKITSIYIKKKLGIFYRMYQYRSKSLNYSVNLVKDVNGVMDILETIDFTLI